MRTLLLVGFLKWYGRDEVVNEGVAILDGLNDTGKISGYFVVWVFPANIRVAIQSRGGSGGGNSISLGEGWVVAGVTVVIGERTLYFQ
ncbi:MAG: hypothetical protein NTX04_06290 [Verrucomicrobia bacterium]|nr:hypothetical protein [Verrucomicrobiota bacterium]